jgi:hypothetical protein
MSKDIPEIDVKLESKTVENKIVKVPWVMITTPYMIISDKDSTRKVWTKDKIKIFLYYAYKITGIKWFIHKYNKR